MVSRFFSVVRNCLTESLSHLYVLCSSEFALRSYLYIIFHELVGRPASWLFAEEKVSFQASDDVNYLLLFFFFIKKTYFIFAFFILQVRVFYAVRLFLGFLSVISDATLVVALSRKYGKRLASYTLAMLCLASGCFFASTSEWFFRSLSISRMMIYKFLSFFSMLIVRFQLLLIK